MQVWFSSRQCIRDKSNLHQKGYGEAKKKAYAIGIDSSLYSVAIRTSNSTILILLKLQNGENGVSGRE